MGYYIETPRPHNKAQFIAGAHDAIIVTIDQAKTALAAGKGVICVVDNGNFEAAAFMYNEKELHDFSDPQDMRPKTWLIIDRELAERLSGYRA